MKTYKSHRILNIGLFSLCFMWILLGTSCKKQENSSITPIITKVSLVDDSTFDSTFSKAKRGTLIVIRGENLQDAITVYFNGMAADFNPVYNTSTNLIVRIPENAPAKGTSPDLIVPNEIQLITKHGEAKFSFSIELPPPTIYSVSNENVLPGDSVYFYGTSFFGIEKVIFPGNLEVTDFSTNSLGTILKTVAPINMTERGPVSIQSIFGSYTTFHSINNINGPEVFNNFDDVNFYNGSGGYSVKVSNSPIDFPGNNGNYGVFDASGIPAGNQGWTDPGRSVNLAKKVLISPDSLGVSAGKYAIKFEIFVKEPWEAGVMRIVPSTLSTPTYTALYKPWALTSTQKFVTEGWVTATIPLTDFKLSSGTGESARTLSDLINVSGINAINLRFYAESGAAVGRIHMAVDNMRLVRIIP